MVKRCTVQLFSVLMLLASSVSLFGELSIGQSYPLHFSGLNGETLSTADGHITILVVVTRATWMKAQLVGDRVPDIHVGDSQHRLITVVKFGNHSAPIKAVLTAGARRRLNLEAKRSQPRYDAKKITRNPSQDIFAAADFDDSIASKLGVETSVDFRAFVFGRNGELLGQWNEVPSAEELATVLR